MNARWLALVLVVTWGSHRNCESTSCPTMKSHVVPQKMFTNIKNVRRCRCRKGAAVHSTDSRREEQRPVVGSSGRAQRGFVYLLPQAAVHPAWRWRL